MSKSNYTMRVLHRYLGFFLMGIMAVYAISGIVLIFRDTDFLKSEQTEIVKLKPNIAAENLGKALEMRRFEVEKTAGDIIYFRDGEYNSKTGVAKITSMELPYVLDKMTHIHKAKSEDPLHWLNVFFGLGLLFFVISAMWMYIPKSNVLKSGLLFTLGGIVLTLVLLFI